MTISRILRRLRDRAVERLGASLRTLHRLYGAVGSERWADVADKVILAQSLLIAVLLACGVIR